MKRKASWLWFLCPLTWPIFIGFGLGWAVMRAFDGAIEATIRLFGLEDDYVS